MISTWQEIPQQDRIDLIHYPGPVKLNLGYALLNII